jgi:hypothetical protein
VTDDSVVARYLNVPVTLYLEMQAHNDAVGRDLMLAMSGGAQPAIASRLAGLVGEHFDRLVDAREGMRAQIEAARAEGRSHVDIVGSYRRSDVPAALAYLETVEEADELVRRGIIFVPNPGEGVARIRRWFTEEMYGQVHEGREPTPFVDAD